MATSTKGRTRPNIQRTGQQRQKPGQAVTENKEEKSCIWCGNPIPRERLRYLPNTESCVRCAVEHPEPRRTADEVCDDLSLPGEELD